MTAEHGVIIEIKNKFSFENPTVTFDDGDVDSSGEIDMPFIELEIAHKLHATLSQYSSEVIDFNISSIESKIVNHGVYYQSENDLNEDNEALE